MSDAETIDRLRGWPPPNTTGHPAKVGPSEYRYSAQRGQWARVSGEGPATVTPVQEGGWLVCSETCTLPNYTRVHTFKPGDRIYVEAVRQDDILFVPYGGVLTLRMTIAQVDQHWRSPPPTEKKAYEAPTIHKLPENEVMRRCVKELRRLAGPLHATIILHADQNTQIQLRGPVSPDAREVHELVDCLDGPVVVTAPASDDPRRLGPPERMAALAETFPSLQGNRIPGVRPWEPLLLMRASGLSHGELCSVRFVLWVWDPHKTDWPCGPFDLGDAIGVWDATHRKAFTDWAAKPWWP